VLTEKSISLVNEITKSQKKSTWCRSCSGCDSFS
jgi:hypothetical protein